MGLEHALRRAIILALTLVAFAGRASVAQAVWQPAAGHAQIPIWPNSPPDARSDVGAEKTRIPVDRAGKNRLVGGRPFVFIENVTKPTITVYAPKRANTGAAVVVFPGGGYNVLAIDLEGTEACDWLTSIGVTCVLLKYRVPCKVVGGYRDCPTAHQDAQRAVRLVRSRAAEWRIDPNKIGVLGFSAGGHMVAAISAHLDKRLYAPVDAADKLSCRPDFALAIYPGHVVSKARNMAPNPDVKFTNRAPPTFLVHAYDDPVDPVEDSYTYFGALRKAGVVAEMHLYATGGHAFGLRRTAASSTAWPQLAESWLKTIGVIAE